MEKIHLGTNTSEPSVFRLSKLKIQINVKFVSFTNLKSVQVFVNFREICYLIHYINI